MQVRQSHLVAEPGFCFRDRLLSLTTEEEQARVKLGGSILRMRSLHGKRDDSPTLNLSLGNLSRELSEVAKQCPEILFLSRESSTFDTPSARDATEINPMFHEIPKKIKRAYGIEWECDDPDKFESRKDGHRVIRIDVLFTPHMRDTFRASSVRGVQDYKCGFTIPMCVVMPLPYSFLTLEDYENLSGKQKRESSMLESADARALTDVASVIYDQDVHRCPDIHGDITPTAHAMNLKQLTIVNEAA